MKFVEYREVDGPQIRPSILRCPFSQCNARIISSDNLGRVNVQNSPSLVNVLKDQVHDIFYIINDVWDFDNIGVLRPTADIQQPIIEGDDSNLDIKIERLLICSECDKGPLGFAGFEGNETDVKKLKYFLSCRSVLYQLQ
jgi:hypothetical protein